MRDKIVKRYGNDEEEIKDKKGGDGGFGKELRKRMMEIYFMMEKGKRI